MAKQPEARLQRRIRKRLEREVGGFWFKTWGGPFGVGGIPDLIGCVYGRYFAFEVKTSKGVVSELQRQTMAWIRAAGGIACVVRTPREAVDVVREAMPYIGRVSDEGRSVRRRSKDRRDILRTGDREDVDNRRTDRDDKRRNSKLQRPPRSTIK